jgi:uncharacterized protein
MVRRLFAASGRCGGIAFAVAAALWLVVIHAMLLASAPPVERHLRLHVSGWPAGTPPMRIALISDLHVATPSDSPRHLARVVTQVNATRPDLVLIAGDFLSTDTWLVHPASIPDAVDPLAKLRAPMGVIAVLGNHDYRDTPALASALRRAGVTLLTNQASARGPVTVVGVADLNTLHADAKAALAEQARIGGIPIMLSHTPDISPTLDPRVKLVLAGHTHCGQIAPWPIGPILTASLYGRRYACGLIREGDRSTLVTAGLGVSNLPLRLGAMPDFWVIDLGR